MSKSTDRLCAALARQMTRSAKGNLPMGPELGQIVRAYRDGRYVLDLIPDSLRKTIPQGSYSTLDSPLLEGGDRVVVLWVGNEPVVLGRLTAT